MRRLLVDGWGPLSRLLLAPTCVLCGARGADGGDLCAGCASDLPHNSIACPRCALPLAAPAPACAHCLRRPPPQAATLAALRYEGAARHLLPRYKFGADLAIGRVLADLLLAVAADAPRPELVAPVPLHAARLRQRGFDQAWELARAVAGRLDQPARPDALRRVRATLAQTGLDAVARRRNLRQAFAIAGDVAGRRVALVDDVMTTGATVEAAVRALRRAGANRVDVWVVARAPR
ncbi:MAG: ComF family protein [Pseudomonadota bacterium]